MAEVPITWEVIDHATDRYAKTLHQYNLSELIKALLKSTKKTASYAVLPAAGNLDIDDSHVGFHDFLVARDDPTHPSLKAAAAAPLVRYLQTGAHPKASKTFAGWKRTLASKKPMVVGTLSIDLPEKETEMETTVRYTCSGTQHYVAFVYLKASHTLYLFDSASKNPVHDKNEINDILYYTFGEPTLTHIPFKYVLQPGAGDRRSEDTRSFNNQNVFCHTWSLWFLTMFMTHYNPADPKTSEATLAKLAHSSERLNLAMIKKFAINTILPLIYEPPSPARIAAKFPVRAYERAVERNDTGRLRDIYTQYLKHAEPMAGLGYIYDYLHRRVVAI